MTTAVATQLRVPHVVAYSGEVAPQPLCFVNRPLAEPRLAYDNQRPSDTAHGALRARVLNNQQGEPQWRKVNTARQWRCMDKLLCQVCGESATDPETGRIPWITTAAAFRGIPDAPNSGLTSAPPTCAACIPEALTMCPRLTVSSAVWTVASRRPVAILADMYVPDLYGRPTPTGERHVFISLTDRHLLRSALATQLVVRIDDMRRAPHLAGREQKEPSWHWDS